MVSRYGVAAAVGLALAAPAMSSPFKVMKITVLQTGTFHANPGAMETPAVCARFKPSSVQILRWFKHARQVSKFYWLEQLDWTPCEASGTLTTSDGQVGRWKLDPSGRADILLSTAKSLFFAGHEISY